MCNVKQKFMLKKLTTFRFSQEDVIAYRDFSKDDNPVHQTGIVYGMQLMAKVEGILMAYFKITATRQFCYYFLKPVIINEEIVLFISSNQHFELRCENRLVGRGKIGNV